MRSACMCGQLMALMETMNTAHDLDWNLWLVLHALLENGSVTEAARKLSRTQSAVSHSLAILRVHFQDPLFVRVGARFEPTPRARALTEPVKTLMRAATEALTPPPEFSPATLQRTFRLFMSDYAQVVLLPSLLKRLTTEAPRVTLDVQFRSDAPTAILNDLAAAKYDVSIGPMNDAPAGLVRQRLYGDRNVCVLRRRHPALQRFTAKRFAELPHVLVSARGLARDFVDDALEKKKLKRHIALRVPHFATVPHFIAETDAVAVVPERIAAAWKHAIHIEFVEAPIPLPPFSMAQLFPELLRNDPAHTWLRRLIQETARG